MERLTLEKATNFNEILKDEGFITKGDANEGPDQWIVKKENVIGKVILTIPLVGYLGYFVRTPIGFILLIVIPASLIIIMEIRNIIKEIKKTKQGGKKREKEAEETREDLLKASKNLRQKIRNLEREKTQLTEELKKLMEAGEAKATILAKEIEEVTSLRKLRRRLKR